MTGSTEANVIKFEAWYGQPIHCPFCGAALVPSAQNRCKHLLYVILGGNFVERSERFDRLLEVVVGTEENLAWPEFSYADKQRWGKPHAAATKIRSQLCTSMEFQILDPGDCAYIGYAAHDEELCGWGIDHQSSDD